MDQYQFNEPTSPRSPLAPYPYPANSTQLRSRAPEFYGFVAWTSTYALFVLYVLWALFPDEWIARLGIEWYPSREWAILLPAYSVILILLTYFTYWALALYSTPSLGDMCTIIDTHAHIPIPIRVRDTSTNTDTDTDTDTITSTDINASADMSTNTKTNTRTNTKPTVDPYLAAASPSGGAVSGIYDVPITLVSRVLYDRTAPREGGREEA